MRDACHPALGATLPSRAPGPPPCAPLRAQWCARHLASRGPACGGARPPHPVHALGRGPSTHGPEAAGSCLPCRRCQGPLMCGATGLPVGCSVGAGGRRPETSGRREGRSPRTGRPRWTWDQTAPPGTASAGWGSRDPVRGPSPLAPCPCHAIPGRGAFPPAARPLLFPGWLPSPGSHGPRLLCSPPVPSWVGLGWVCSRYLLLQGDPFPASSAGSLVPWRRGQNRVRRSSRQAALGRTHGSLGPSTPQAIA